MFFFIKIKICTFFLLLLKHELGHSYFQSVGIVFSFVLEEDNFYMPVVWAWLDLALVITPQHYIDLIVEFYLLRILPTG